MVRSCSLFFGATVLMGAAILSPAWGQPLLVLGESAYGLRVVGYPDGVYVDESNFNGVLVQTSAHDGIRVDRAGSVGTGATYSLLNDGYEIANAEGRGLFVGQAGFEGLAVYRSLGDGLKIYTAGSPVGIAVSSPAANGIEIESAQGNGLFIGHSDGDGVRVQSGGANGGYFRTEVSNGNGIYAVANNGPVAYGVWGEASQGYAGFFSGKVQVVGDLAVFGTLSKSAGSFRIDHPLDPENKFLSHAFVESPDMKNVYDGVVVLDALGEAEVELPEYFAALNRDFRYQLTTVGGFAPVYIAQEIEGNRFRIAGGRPELKVSWQVTGIRQDPYAEENPVVVEEWKPDEDRGYYLYPAGYGQPERLTIGRGLEKPNPDQPVFYGARPAAAFVSTEPLKRE